MFLGFGLSSIMLMATVIEERRQVDKRLREREQRLGILFEFAPDAYYLTDVTGTFVDGNRAAEKLIGYAREELIGRNFLALNLLHPREVRRARRFWLEALRERPLGPMNFS
jgi:PAS domain S-box-containing protein